MVKLTLQYGQAYVSVTAAFLLCSPFVLIVEQTGNKQGTRGTDREQTVNIGGGWGRRHPPAIRRGPGIDMHAHHMHIPQIPLKPFCPLPCTLTLLVFTMLDVIRTPVYPLLIRIPVLVTLPLPVLLTPLC